MHVELSDWLLAGAVAAAIGLLTRVVLRRMAGKLDAAAAGQMMRVPFHVRLHSFILKYGALFLQQRDGTILRTGFLGAMARDPRPSNESFTKFETATRDVTLLCENRKLEVRIFLPKLALSLKPSAKLPIALFFHGGGFSFASMKDGVYDSMCRRIAFYVGMLVVSVEYRLAPESPYPSAYDDGYEALKWLKNKAIIEDKWVSKYADISNCFLFGDSAGANLAHHVSLRAREVDFSPLQIRGRCLMFPFFGGTDKLQSEIEFSNGYIVGEKILNTMWRNFLPKGADQNHMAANPLAPAHPSLKNLQPTLVQVAGYDYLKDRGILYANALKEAGVDLELIHYPHMIHCFPLFGVNSDSFFSDLTQFVRRVSVN